MCKLPYNIGYQIDRLAQIPCQYLGGAELPKSANISPQERRNWLERYEDGERIDEIAKQAHRDTRTATTNIDRAHQERDFAAAQRDQLREALQSHQRDMLGLLERIGQSVGVLALDYPTYGPDFGLEDLLEPNDLARHSQVGLPKFQFSPTYAHEPVVSRANLDPPYVTIIRDSSGPKDVYLALENSRLWRMLKEHIGARDVLWKLIANWQKALLEECQARAELNRVIRTRAREATGLNVLLLPQSQQPHLTCAFSWIARSHVTMRALDEPLVSLKGGICACEGGILRVGSFTIAEWLSDTGMVKQQLEGVTAAMVEASETKRAVQTYQKLQAKVMEVRDSLEEYLLLRHLAGRCKICKKLAGQ